MAMVLTRWLPQHRSLASRLHLKSSSPSGRWDSASRPTPPVYIFRTAATCPRKLLVLITRRITTSITSLRDATTMRMLLIGGKEGPRRRRLRRDLGSDGPAALSENSSFASCNSSRQPKKVAKTVPRLRAPVSSLRCAAPRRCGEGDANGRLLRLCFNSICTPCRYGVVVWRCGCLRSNQVLWRCNRCSCDNVIGALSVAGPTATYRWRPTCNSS